MEELKQIKQWYRAFNRMLASVGGASVLEHTERDGVEGVRITLTPGSIGQRAGGGGGGASKMRHVLSIQFKAGLTEGGFDVAAASLKSVSGNAPSPLHNRAYVGGVSMPAEEMVCVCSPCIL